MQGFVNGRAEDSFCATFNRQVEGSIPIASNQSNREVLLIIFRDHRLGMHLRKLSGLAVPGTSLPCAAQVLDAQQQAAVTAGLIFPLRSP